MGIDGELRVAAAADAGAVVVNYAEVVALRIVLELDGESAGRVLGISATACAGTVELSMCSDTASIPDNRLTITAPPRPPLNSLGPDSLGPAD